MDPNVADKELMKMAKDNFRMIAEEEEETIDSYGVDYAAYAEMEILRPGKVNWWEATMEMLQELVATYDINLLRAPLCVDHQMGGPAFGHILSLEIRDVKTDTGEIALWAIVGLLPSGLAMIESGEYNERSVYISEWYPTEGFFYLRHLSLLGSANPACKGMGPIIILPAEDDEEAIAEAYPQALEMVASDMVAVWEKSDEYIRYRVRPPSRFIEGTFRTVELSKKKGIKAVQAKLKPKYVPKDKSKDSMVNQAILFDVKKWDITKAKAWVKKNKNSLSIAMAAALLGGDNLVEAQELLNELPLELERAGHEIGQAIIDESQDDGIELFGVEHVEDGDGIEKTEEPGDELSSESKTDDESQKGKPAIKAITIHYDTEEAAEVDSAVQDTTETAEAVQGGKAEMSKTAEEVAAAKAAQEEAEKKIASTTEDPAEMTAEEVTILVEADNVDELKKQNLQLLRENREANRKALTAQQELRKKLADEKRVTRAMIIETQIDNLIAQGFIVPGQKDFGLVDALLSIPEGAVVKVGKEGAEILAHDAILETLKMGGRLKLKGEIATEEKAITGKVSKGLEKLATSGVKVTGLEIAQRIEELRAANPKLSYADAYEQAEQEGGGP